MGWNEVVGEVAARLPDFNNELLIGYKKRNVDNCRDYLRDVFLAVTDHINASIRDIHVDYIGYEVLSPVDQLRYESAQSITKGRYNISTDGVRLVEYKFNVTSTNDVGRTMVEQQSVRLYLPYWINNGVIINGRQYYFKHVMSDIIVRIDGHRFVVGEILSLILKISTVMSIRQPSSQHMLIREVLTRVRM